MVTSNTEQNLSSACGTSFFGVNESCLELCCKVRTMDACSRVRGVRPRAAVRKEIVRESWVHNVKSLRHKKDLCSICLELPTRDTTRLAEINFVCLPSRCEGEEASQQTLQSLPMGLCELLQPHHVQSLKQDEVLLLRDYRRISDHKDAATQVLCKAVCVMRNSPRPVISAQSSVSHLLGLLGCYMAGIRYALETKGFSGGRQQEEDDTNQSVSSIEDDFVTALEHLEDDDSKDKPGAASFRYLKKHDVASQTIPSHKRKKELLGSRIIISSAPKKHPEMSVTVQKSEGMESQWTICSPKARLPSPCDHISESDESNCSSPSPIIFLDDVDHKAAFAEEMVSMAMAVAKRELSNTSLNADSGIGYDGTSYAESLTAEIMTSALTNVCQAPSSRSQGREVTESTVSQQLSVGDDSLGSWSNISFEDEHPDENSSFLHLSDSNGNSSSWSSLGLEGEACDECLSSPSDSDHIDDKDTENKDESIGTVCIDRTEAQAPRMVLVILNSDVVERGRGLDVQLRSLLQWVAASMADVPQIQLSPDRELQQLPAVVQKLREKRWHVGELLHILLRYCEESPVQSEPPTREDALQAGRDTPQTPLFQWLLEIA
uniref:Uncharacterized protein n=1 Tax=Knipowitschia caucasica TaxID=637954 RepID=A0AAV2K3L3_KNICA